MRTLKSISAALFLSMLVSCGDAPTVTCYSVDSLLKVFPENIMFANAPDTLDAAGATHVEFQFALRSAEEVRDFTVTCTSLKGPDGCEIPAPRCGVVGYVGVSDAMNEPPHDVLKSATGMFPDPILERDSYAFAPSVTFCPWITVYVPAGSKEGTYSGTVRMHGKSGGRSFTFVKEIHVRVWPVTMKDPDFPNVNWAFDFDHCMKLWNGGTPVEKYSEDHKEYLAQLYGIMAGCHQTMVQMPVWDVVKMTRSADRTWEFDFTEFDFYVDMAQKSGAMKIMQIDELGHRIEPFWTSPMGLFVPVEKDGRVDKETFAPSAPEVREFYSCFIPALKAHLEETGWADRCYLRICDEPIDDNAQSYCEAVRAIREFWPDMKVIEACQTTGISDAVDAWCPQLDYWHNNYPFFQSRKKAGDEVWFYTCCYPHGEYPNRFIEQPLLKTRMIFWMAQKYKADGYLHWGFNYWVDDPFVETSLPGTGTSLPGGDAWLIYPGDRKMLRSIRYEQHRDGLEDLALLQMLAERSPEHAQYLVDCLITNWWVYVGSPELYRQTRRELLKALSE